MCRLRRDDLHLIATIEARGDGHYTVVYLGTYGVVANLGVYVVGEVEDRSTVGQGVGLALRGEDHDVALVEAQLEVIQELQGTLGRGAEGLTYLT